MGARIPQRLRQAHRDADYDRPVPHCSGLCLALGERMVLFLGA
jgi:hypothetical protein